MRINLCSIGDPTIPSTWSGTPNNIYRVLARRDRLAEVFNAEGGIWEKRLLSLLSLPLYGSIDRGRHPLRRYAASARVARVTDESECKITLHTYAFSLPFRRRPTGQKHYLLCDATWAQATRYSTAMPGYGPRLRKVSERLERMTFEQVDHIFPIGQHVADDLRDTYGISEDHITAVGTGLGAINPYSGPKDYAAKRILFTAKQRFEDKGGHLALEAFRIARTRDPEVTMTVVGCEEGLQLPPTPGLSVLGFVSLSELQELFETHTLFLLPALNEPWGLVYLEAMACGMAILGLQRNSFPELSGHGRYGFGAVQPDADELAGLILRAFEEPGALQAMGTAAREWCLNNYTWEKTVDRILQVIEADNA